MKLISIVTKDRVGPEKEILTVGGGNWRKREQRSKRPKSLSSITASQWIYLKLGNLKVGVVACL